MPLPVISMGRVGGCKSGGVDFRGQMLLPAISMGRLGGY